MDDLQRMAGGWKELISVSEGFDRTLLPRFWKRDTSFRATTGRMCWNLQPHVYHTLSEVQASCASLPAG